MDSIERVWIEFDQIEGMVNLEQFQYVMFNVATDQKLLDGDDDQAKQNAMFFTPDNLSNIFEQIINS